MRSQARPIVAVAVLLASNAFPVLSMAQPAGFEFAPDHFIVKVLAGVAPVVLPDGRPTFASGQDAGQPPGAILGELLIAEILEAWGATAIKPLIDFELRPEVLAHATEAGIMRQYTVEVPEGGDIMLVTEILSLFVTHVEHVTPSWYGELSQTSDPLFDDQWPLNNTGQPLNFPLIDFGCCPCGNGEGQMGTPDADIDAPEAWAPGDGRRPGRSRPRQ